MVLAALDAVKGGMRNTDSFGEIRIREAPPRLSYVARKLAVQISLHLATVAKLSSRMRDDLRLRNRLLVVCRGTWRWQNR